MAGGACARLRGLLAEGTKWYDTGMQGGGREGGGVWDVILSASGDGGSRQQQQQQQQQQHHHHHHQQLRPLPHTIFYRCWRVCVWGGAEGRCQLMCVVQ